MSHLSQIKTKLYNTKILQKTLHNLGFTHELRNSHQRDIIVKTEQNLQFELIWNDQEYYIVADTEIWNNSLNIESLVEKITQQYSYNSIIEESNKYGFNSINKEFMKDGSIKLTVQRWS